MKKKLNLQIAAGPVGEPGLEGFEDVAGGILYSACGAYVRRQVNQLREERIQIGVVHTGKDALDVLERHSDGSQMPIAEVPGGFHIGVTALQIWLYLDFEDETPLPLTPQKPDFPKSLKLRCCRRKYLAGKIDVSFLGSAQGQQPTQFVGRYDESSLAAPGADKPVKTQRMPHDRKQMHCEGPPHNFKLYKNIF